MSSRQPLTSPGHGLYYDRFRTSNIFGGLICCAAHHGIPGTPSIGRDADDILHKSVRNVWFVSPPTDYKDLHDIHRIPLCFELEDMISPAVYGPGGRRDSQPHPSPLSDYETRDTPNIWEFSRVSGNDKTNISGRCAYWAYPAGSGPLCYDKSCTALPERKDQEWKPAADGDPDGRSDNSLPPRLFHEVHHGNWSIWA